VSKVMHLLVVRCLASVAALLLVCGNVQAAGQSPNEMIEEAIALFAEELNGNKEALAADKDALYAVVNKILLPRFDRNAAARAVLGKHRSDATAEQIERFTEAFYTTLLRRYSEGLLEFENDKIKVLEFRGDLAARSATVRTQVRLDTGTKVPVNYLLANQNPGWLMLDVKIEGVSYIRNFRTELDLEVRSSSLAAVIDRLENEAGISSGE
jgi:phospholipid transport system substrate-binding protein